MIKIGYSRWRISLRIGKVMKKDRGGLLLDAERRLEVMRKTIGYWQHTIGMLSEGYDRCLACGGDYDGRWLLCLLPRGEGPAVLVIQDRTFVTST
jgi:hypothetical protein